MNYLDKFFLTTPAYGNIPVSVAAWLNKLSEENDITVVSSVSCGDYLWVLVQATPKSPPKKKAKTETETPAA